LVSYYRGVQCIKKDFGFLHGKQFEGINSTAPERVFNIVDSNNNSDGNNTRFNEVILEFVGNTPYTTKPTESPEGSGIYKLNYDQGKQTFDPLMNIRIIPNDQDWLKFTMNHSWDEGGIMAKILSTISEAGRFIDEAIETAGNLGGDQNLTQRTLVSDILDRYQGTEKMEFTVPFTLFTAGGSLDRFIDDIFFPVYLLKAYSAGKRNIKLTRGLFDTVDEGEPAPANAGQEGGIPAESGGGPAENPQPTTADDTENTLLDIANSYPGFRTFIVDPPSYISVRHNSGLFNFPRCAITSFDYQYKGPWVNASSDQQKMGQYSSYNAKRNIMEVSYPTICECNLTFKVLEQMYADDWITMFTDSPIVKATEQNSSGKINIFRRTSELNQDILSFEDNEGSQNA